MVSNNLFLFQETALLLSTSRLSQGIAISDGQSQDAGNDTEDTDSDMGQEDEEEGKFVVVPYTLGPVFPDSHAV